jgi:hypothetical protein
MVRDGAEKRLLTMRFSCSKGGSEPTYQAKLEGGCNPGSRGVLILRSHALARRLEASS